MHTREPLYRQIGTQILDRLAAGEWKPGERLPTEPELAERFGVAVFTIRAGIRDLVAANILVRRQGKGTFVARHDRHRQRNQYSHVFGNDGVKTAPERKLVSFNKTAADRQTAEMLRLPADEKRSVYNIECILRVEERPIAIVDIAVPALLFVGLSARVIRASDEQLYAVWQNVCGVNVILIEERVYAAKAGARAGRILGIEANDPVLRIDRVAYTYNDVPVEFRSRIQQAGDYHYRIREGGL